MTVILAGCPRLGGQRPLRPFRFQHVFRGRRRAALGGRAPDAADAVQLAAAVTRAASRQTYLTIRLLVEPSRRAAAFCAYAYFRWVDDVLDAPDPGPSDEARRLRMTFLQRQQAILERGLDGRLPATLTGHEAMLQALLKPGHGTGDALDTYLRQMMRVMDFDARRRGQLVSATELEQYTVWLATAVTEAMRYFLDDTDEPRSEMHRRAVTGAHILHMLRDTFVDLDAGYVNVPQEVLAAGGILPGDIGTDAYRAWVRERTEQARICLEQGRAYFRSIGSWRHRMAGLAYIARFEWLIGQLQQDGYLVRPDYPGQPHVGRTLRVGRQAVWQSLWTRPAGTGERLAL